MAVHDELNEITLQLAQLEKQKQQLLERQRDLEHQLQGSLSHGRRLIVKSIFKVVSACATTAACTPL